MDPTFAIGSSAPSGSGEPARPSGRLGKDEFVKLLLAQLGNQDPLQPTDNQAFVAQLAQFASIELQQTANSQLEAMLLAQAAANQTQAASLVGKDALVKSDGVTLGEAGTVGIRGELSGAAASFTCVITDASGKTIRTLTLPAQKAGSVELTWDGLDAEGNRAPAGAYKVKLSALDADGKSVVVEPRVLGRIRGVTFEKGYPELLIGKDRVKLSDVVELAEPRVA